MSSDTDKKDEDFCCDDEGPADETFPFDLPDEWRFPYVKPLDADCLISPGGLIVFIDSDRTMTQAKINKLAR